MALTDCGNGHLYDNSQHSSCPYCSGQNKVIDYTRRGSGGGTVMPGMGGGNGGSSGGRTVMPGMDGGSSGGQTVGPGGSGGGTVAPEWFRRKTADEPDSPRGGKTVIPDWMKIGNTGSDSAKNEPPVVGWLVCVDGKNRGKDYRLLAKINKVGRELSNDVSIDDRAISRDNHVSIAYDFRHNQFHILPGNASESSAYVNEEPIYAPLKLQSHARIVLGNSIFLFIPLCDDQFRWNTGEQEKNG